VKIKGKLFKKTLEDSLITNKHFPGAVKYIIQMKSMKSFIELETKEELGGSSQCRLH